MDIKIKHLQAEIGLFFILGYGSCFFCFLATFLIIYSYCLMFFVYLYASVDCEYFVKCSSFLVVSLR